MLGDTKNLKRVRKSTIRVSIFSFTNDNFSIQSNIISILKNT